MPLRPLTIAAGLALVAASWWVPVRSSSEDGGRTLEGFWTAMAGIAIAVAGTGIGTRGRRAAALAGLFVIGAAAQLGLLNPLWLHYLRLRPHEIREPLALLSLAALAVQAGVVLALGWRAAGEFVRGIRIFARGFALPAMALLFLAAAAHVTPVWLHRHETLYRLGFAAQLLASGGILLLNLAHLVLIVRAHPGDSLRRAWERLRTAVSFPGEDREPTRMDRALPFLLAGIVFAVAAVMSLGVWGRIPHIQDEVAFLFQARCYAQGRLDLPPPPEPEAFEYYLLRVQDGKWYGAMNPGWPLVLAGAMKLGFAPLLNPLLGALGVLAAHALARRLLDRGTAHVVAGLLAVSPWYVLVAGSYMTQTLSQLLMLLTAWLLVRAAQERTVLPAFLGGLALGMQFLVRPMDALLVGAAAAAAFLGFGRMRLRWPAWLALGAGGLLTSAWFLPFNAHFTGHPLVFTISHYFDLLWYPGADRLGFAPDIGNPVPHRWVPLDPEPGHGLRDVALNANQNLANINLELFGWGIGSLLLPAIHLLRGRKSRSDAGAALFLVLVVAGYSTYWFSGGPDFGARYWFLVLFPLVWLSFRGLETVREGLAARWPSEAWGARVGAAVAVLVLATLAVFVPWRLVAKYPDYRGANRDLADLHESGRFGRDLVFVDVEDRAEYGPALVLNPLPLDGDGPVYALDLGPESRERVRQAFPDRAAWRVRGRSASGGRTVIVGGPEPALRPR